MSDVDEVFFGKRRKVLNELVSRLETLFDLTPTARIVAMTDLNMNILLHRLAFMVEQDNDIFEIILRLDKRKHDSVDSLIILLAEEIRKIKGVDTSAIKVKLEELKTAIADLQQYKSTLNLMREIEPDLRDEVKKRKKWKKNNR